MPSVFPCTRFNSSAVIAASAVDAGAPPQLQEAPMRSFLIPVLIAALLAPAALPAATLQNTDLQSYQLLIEPFDGPPRYYTIIENAQVEICEHGCRMTLIAGRQTVMVKPNDAVVIDSGVISVSSGD
jgi:hypothetical protein